MAAARRASIPKKTKIDQENGACAGWLATSGGNAKNPSGNPRHAPPASGRAARRTNADRMGPRFLTPTTYHVTEQTKDPAGTAGPAETRAPYSGVASDMA